MKKIVLLTVAFMCFFVTMAQETLSITFSDEQTLTWSNSHDKTEYVVIEKATNYNVPAFLGLPSSEEYLVYDNSYYEENHKNDILSKHPDVIYQFVDGIMGKEIWFYGDKVTKLYH